MSDDFASNLENYKIQYQQVCTSLKSDPTNDELINLKKDLEEVISLTKELINPGNQNTGSNEQGGTRTAVEWKVGDQCLARSSKNGQYYEALIDSLTDTQAAVTFTSRQVTDLCDISLLKAWKDLGEAKAGDKGIWSSMPKSANAASSSKNAAMNALKKTEFAMEREKRQRKNKRRAEKLKEMEEQKESEKNKWKNFNTKAMAKSMKGVKRNRSTVLESREEGMVGRAQPKQIYSQAEYSKP